MPISEDEFDFHQQPHNPSINMSKAELRKTHKPIMEKRRRARINHCLNEIKTLILEAMNKDPARHSKLEKADILEMAVKHLQNVQRQQLAIAMANDPTVLRKFKSGFNECASEIDRYVNQTDTDDGLKDRMRNHLQKCITGIEQVAHFSFPPFSNLQFSNNLIEPSSSSSTSGDQNNNSNARIQIPAHIQLIPSRLPSGEIALLLPNSQNLPFLTPQNRPSAFATVVPSSSSTSTSSPPASPKGFRPVQQQQVPLISSSVELNLKYQPPRKIEPLCIITNQSERYKQAQMKEESIRLEENRVQGIKRQATSSNADHSPRKIVKLEELPAVLPAREAVLPARDVVPPAREAVFPVRDVVPPAREAAGECSNDMWRPW